MFTQRTGMCGMDGGCLFDASESEYQCTVPGLVWTSFCRDSITVNELQVLTLGTDGGIMGMIVQLFTTIQG